MNAARHSDGLLSARQTIALLALIAPHKRGCSEEQALHDLTATTAASRSRARNTVAMLRSLDVLHDHEGRVRINAAETEHVDRWPERLGQLTAKLLADRIVSEKAASCIQARGPKADLWLDSMLLPGAGEGLPLWVVEFAVATRERIGSRFWQVSDQYKAGFLDSARAANHRRRRRSLSAVQLEEKLAAQALQGIEGEEWVLHFERQRLTNHPLLDQVRRVSEEDVAAGYDIASFSSLSTLHHDLFIEVKSFAGAKRFFWTRNEIETAEELGEQYALYLVDIGNMRAPGYKPQIIPGAHSALFLSIASGWSVSPTTYECIADPGA